MFLLLTCALTWASRAQCHKNKVRHCNSNSYSSHLELHLQLLWSSHKIASTAIALVNQICPRHRSSQSTRSVIEEYLTSNKHSLSKHATSISVIDKTLWFSLTTSTSDPEIKLETFPKTDCINKNFPTWTCSNLNWSKISTNLRTSHSVLF